MPLQTQRDFQELIEQFLLRQSFNYSTVGLQSVRYRFSNDNERLNFIQTQIEQMWVQEGLPRDVKAQIQRAIIDGCRAALRTHKDNLSHDVQQRRNLFKQRLNLLFMERGLTKEIALGTKHPATKVNHNINADKSRYFPENEQHLYPTIGTSSLSYAVIGDLFCTNIDHIFQQRGEQPVSQVLDAFYSAYHADGGLIAAIADGAGGHNDKDQDTMISKVSSLATKKAVHYLSQFDNADILMSNMSWVISQLTRDLEAIQPSEYYESAILTAVRLYPVNENEVRCVGFNTGDCLLAMWDPKTRRLITLSPAVGMISEVNGKVTPGSLPYGYTPNQIRLIDQVIPLNSLMVLMSDGVYGYLPCNNEDNASELAELTLSESAIGESSSIAKFYITKLDDMAISEILRETGSNSAADIAQPLINMMLSSCESERIEHLESSNTTKEEFNRIRKEHDDLAAGSDDRDDNQIKELRLQCHELHKKSNFTLGDDTTLAILPAFLNSPLSPRRERLRPAHYHNDEQILNIRAWQCSRR